MKLKELAKRFVMTSGVKVCRILYLIPLVFTIDVNNLYKDTLIYIMTQTKHNSTSIYINMTRMYVFLSDLRHI